MKKERQGQARKTKPRGERFKELSKSQECERRKLTPTHRLAVPVSLPFRRNALFMHWRVAYFLIY